MTAEYCRRNQGSSDRALEAAAEGKLPLSKAIGAVAVGLGITRREARKTLEEAGPCEWHHTSKYANRTEFYDVRALLHPESDPMPDETCPREGGEGRTSIEFTCQQWRMHLQEAFSTWDYQEDHRTSLAYLECAERDLEHLVRLKA